MVRLFRDGLGLRLSDVEPDFAGFDLPDGDRVEVFGPSDREHTHFDSGPVVGFLVGDIAAARAELEATGMVGLIGPLRVWPGNFGRSTSARRMVTCTSCWDRSWGTTPDRWHFQPAGTCPPSRGRVKASPVVRS